MLDMGSEPVNVVRCRKRKENASFPNRNCVIAEAGVQDERNETQGKNWIRFSRI